MLITTIDTNVFVSGKIYDVLYSWSILLDDNKQKTVAMLYFNRKGKDDGAFIVERYREDLISALHNQGIYENIDTDLQEICNFSNEV